jgi:hypothetical protein
MIDMFQCDAPDFDEDEHLPRPGEEVLWCIRAWVIGTCRATPVAADIAEVLDGLGAADAADSLTAFLWVVGLRTSRRLSIACVCNRGMEADERVLLDVVALYQAGRNIEAMSLLRSVLPPEAALAAREPVTRLASILSSAGHVLAPPGCPAIRQMSGVAHDPPGRLTTLH